MAKKEIEITKGKTITFFNTIRIRGDKTFLWFSKCFSRLDYSVIGRWQRDLK